jgi:glycosyltransferase involved in cell wall biosynthesis
MTITIITVVFNNEKTIANAIQSVLSQRGINLQYIVIDGNSTDRTKVVIHEYRDQIHHFISERDNGLYDAMNKGIRMAEGDVIGILNSDDFYADEFILQRVMNQFESNTIDCLYGDIEYVSSTDINKVIRRWKSGKAQSFTTGWHPPHPGFFLRKEMYERAGLYRTDMQIAADFELMLRMFERYSCKSIYLSEVLVKMREGGKSNESIINILKGYSEIRRAFELNNIPMPFMYPFYRYWPKLKDKYFNMN